MEKSLDQQAYDAGYSSVAAYRQIPGLTRATKERKLPNA